MSLDGESLEKRVAKWLDSQGYPLEMRVAHAFRRAGFFVVQSEHYADPETKKPREIDVAALVQRDTLGILVRVVYTVECKLARDKPWILFTSPDTRLAPPARVSQRAASGLGRKLLEAICQRRDIQSLPALAVPKRPGYGLSQAFTTGQDVPYGAAMAAAKAALAEALDADQATNLQGPLCCVAFPVVVIDGTLFECYLNESLEPTVSEINSGTLLWRNPVVGMPQTIVGIVTTSALDVFVAGALDTARTLLRACDREVAQLAEAIPSGAPRWGRHGGGPT